MTVHCRVTALPGWLLRTIAAAVFLQALSPPAPGQVVVAEDGIGNPGYGYGLTVTLTTSGTSVASLQNSITFDSTNTPIVPNADGTPDCTVNSAIQKEVTSFSFLPAGCTGTACTKVQAIVRSNINTVPIPDGALLYDCNVFIPASAPAWNYTFSVGDVTATDPSAQPLVGAEGRDGEVDAVPTLTVVGANGPAGSTRTFTVRLGSSGSTVLAVGNTITFDSTHTPVVRNADGTPACTVNAAIQKGDTIFSFLPLGCTATTCTKVVAAVLSVGDVTTPIPDNSPLYTCTVNIAAGTPSGGYALTLSAADVSVPRQGVGAQFLGESPNLVNGLVVVPSGGGGGGC